MQESSDAMQKQFMLPAACKGSERNHRTRLGRSYQQLVFQACTSQQTFGFGNSHDCRLSDLWGEARRSQAFRIACRSKRRSDGGQCRAEDLKGEIVNIKLLAMNGMNQAYHCRCNQRELLPSRCQIPGCFQPASDATRDTREFYGMERLDDVNIVISEQTHIFVEIYLGQSCIECRTHLLRHPIQQSADLWPE